MEEVSILHCEGEWGESGDQRPVWSLSFQSIWRRSSILTTAMQEEGIVWYYWKVWLGRELLIQLQTALERSLSCGRDIHRERDQHTQPVQEAGRIMGLVFARFVEFENGTRTVCKCARSSLANINTIRLLILSTNGNLLRFSSSFGTSVSDALQWSLAIVFRGNPEEEDGARRIAVIWARTWGLLCTWLIAVIDGGRLGWQEEHSL